MHQHFEGSVAITTIGGPTALIEMGGLRLLTDPTFDPPGAYEPRPGVHLTKTAGPALEAEELADIDVVLLSHDHHKDNLDDAGREMLARVPSILTTPSGAARLGLGATALPNGRSVELRGRDGQRVTVTGLPAQHGPDGSQELVGEVTGFLLRGDGLPTVYVSGDNASLGVVQAIAADFGPVDVAVLFVGGAQMPYLGDAYLTLPSRLAPEAARLLGAGKVVPVHADGWAHFSDSRESLVAAFVEAGEQRRLALAAHGQTLTLPRDRRA